MKTYLTRIALAVLVISAWSCKPKFDKKLHEEIAAEHDALEKEHYNMEQLHEDLENEHDRWVEAHAALPDAAKWVLCLGMIVGRLEVLALMVIFAPTYWRR